MYGGELPAEMWRLLLQPQDIYERQHWGLGAAQEFTVPERIHDLLCKLLVLIRTQRAAPLQFVLIWGFQVLKCAKPAFSDADRCTSTGTVHAYGGLAKCFYSSVWNLEVCSMQTGRTEYPILPDHAFGGVRFRRREEAIAL